MVSIEEKRVYRGTGNSTPVYVAGDFGVAGVETSDDLVGEFGLEHQCTARDVAGRNGRVAVATDEETLVYGTEGFEPLEVGASTAVGFDGEDLLVAREDGAVFREDGGGWRQLGRLEDVRAIDGPLLAAESGVYRAQARDLDHVGLADARDVSTEGVPLAATADGLYTLGNGWMEVLEGEFVAVSATENTGKLGRAHAAGEDGLFGYDDEWHSVEIPTEGSVVTLAHGDDVYESSTEGDSEDVVRHDAVYAATEDGDFLLSVGDGWRKQVLGLPGVKAIATP
ncbi:HVO_0234 family beta-propeller protein [Halorussus halophilus]|uniref:HVO_0234 family beta-propeller protein n=1 Tax=Halorussus halophilus TaxID=2650975 RepID=UPI001300DD6B|nr:hypothetical protein [Halorussus halophilus]